MNYDDLLNQCKIDGTKCFVNGMPEEGGGKILQVENGFIIFEILDGEGEDKTREIVNIRTEDITTLSTVEKIGTLDAFEDKEKKDLNSSSSSIEVEQPKKEV